MLYFPLRCNLPSWRMPLPFANLSTTSFGARTPEMRTLTSLENPKLTNEATL